MSTGQATVEVVLVTPLLLALGIALVWLALVAAHQVALVDAARAAARAASAGGDEAAARAAAVDAAPGLDPARLELSLTRGGGLVDVRVRYRQPPPLRLLAGLVPTVSLSDEQKSMDESDDSS
jgi:Flp pilus assembly protein TadG